MYKMRLSFKCRRRSKTDTVEVAGYHTNMAFETRCDSAGATQREELKRGRLNITVVANGVLPTSQNSPDLCNEGAIYDKALERIIQ